MTFGPTREVVAQLVESTPVERQVGGSSPSYLTEGRFNLCASRNLRDLIKGQSRQETGLEDVIIKNFNNETLGKYRYEVVAQAMREHIRGKEARIKEILKAIEGVDDVVKCFIEEMCR